jgi:hypothetical protein
MAKVNLFSRILKIAEYLLGKRSELNRINHNDALLAKVVLDIHRKRVESEIVSLPLHSIRPIHPIDRGEALKSKENRVRIVEGSKNEISASGKITLALSSIEHPMKMNWLPALLLSACMFSQDGSPDKAGYAFKELAGFTYVYRNGAIADSFPLPETLQRYYENRVNNGFLTNMKIEIKGDSFFAATRFTILGAARDTAISGRLGKSDADYINLFPAHGCDSMVDGDKIFNMCFGKKGAALSIDICFDLIYEDSTFALETIDIARNMGWNNVPGMKCSERGESEGNMFRSDLALTLTPR